MAAAVCGASLDLFLASAARLPRTLGRGRGQPAQTAAAAAHLISQAEPLLVAHPERAAEIALAVGRIGQLAPETSLVAPFARAYAELAAERLPKPGATWSRVQAREALAAYVALEGLGSSAGVAVLPLAARAAEGAALLEASELVAALARLAAASSSSSPAGRAAAGSALAAASADVAAALQRPLVEKAAALVHLSGPDLCSAAVGLARSPFLMPEAASAVAAALSGRLAELPAPALWDLSRASAELLARLHGAGAGAETAELRALLGEALPLLAASTQSALLALAPGAAGSSGGSAEAVLVLSGLARLAAVFPPESAGAEALRIQILQPNSQALLAAACEDQTLERLELFGPLLCLAGGEAWAGLLRHLALEGLTRLQSGEENAVRTVTILEWVAAADEREAAPPSAGGALAPAFPAFFDFAFEELLRRLPELPPGGPHLRRVVRLLGQAHLERPDLLGDMAAAAASAARSFEAGPSSTPPRLSDIALQLSAFAALYVRLAGIVSARSSEEGQEALKSLAAVFEESSAACQDLVLPKGDKGSQGSAAADDAACLALSAFAQAVCRSPASVAPAARRRLIEAGLQLLDALCCNWSIVTKEKGLSPQQAQIFVTALRGFCAEKGAPPPPASSLELLDGLVSHASAAAPVNREARLCLAVLGELAADPNCPASLRALLPKPQAAEGDQNRRDASGSGAARNAAQERLRAAMAAANGARVAAATGEGMGPPPTGSRAVPGFLRRLFGL
ncbi:unnamed protein product [Polarella glacialis]|uniref:Uncharacterized protein n=1 Tax=Polarella glacialis TaxID=89957 RepID=A0A813GNF2_POLGL|nr:unnamed protein product [Polarella glacialis]